ncbi:MULTISPECIES: flagellar basal body rod protein FlgF [Pseudoxanthomonas]|jgi:fagellar hook-basal body proteins|uniref:Flagellar basal-body rod protein FlgF n=1 Tax=Pseudoxanthomonas taiwanensis J19 TaxID=935569 RepID=A0A562D124_9GAMM|nr:MULTISPECIES: flagellar basal body rod protein FlgF [Pseudoxanthomonas]RRN81014.1 flagellar hook-basal body complex protein [Pseudoxanthomonas sp. SGD-10]TWH03405.1 flagellar basal-body rod protein FlgF [Pseudoxanthomonas taiwanensis J19]
MDSFLYTAVSGADYTRRALAVRANNLANAQTTGFRADMAVAEHLEVSGYGYDSRRQASLTSTFVDQARGRLNETGRTLDVAIQGDGYFVVQAGDGLAYSRAGHFELDDQGALTLDGRPVMGEGGPLFLPPHQSIDIGADGRISVRPQDGGELQEVGRLALALPEPADLVKRPDGLLGTRSGIEYGPDERVRVAAGHLESSNVSAVEEMIQTMQLGRTFEMQMRLFRNADEMAQAGERLIRG